MNKQANKIVFTLWTLPMYAAIFHTFIYVSMHAFIHSFTQEKLTGPLLGIQ